MNIGLDIMGGDFAPLEAVKGLRLFLSEHTAPATVFLFGDEVQATALSTEYALPIDRIRVVNAPQVIEMHEHPTRALKEKQQSSIALGFQ